MLENYLADLKASLTSSPIVYDIDILDEFVTSVSGFLECKLIMIDGSVLYVTEYITIHSDEIKRDKYSYHLQKNDQFLIRWDNAPHHKEISTFPYHVHNKNGVNKSKPIICCDLILVSIVGFNQILTLFFLIWSNIKNSFYKFSTHFFTIMY